MGLSVCQLISRLIDFYFLLSWKICNFLIISFNSKQRVYKRCVIEIFFSERSRNSGIIVWIWIISARSFKSCTKFIAILANIHHLLTHQIFVVAGSPYHSCYFYLLFTHSRFALQFQRQNQVFISSCRHFNYLSAEA